MTPAEPAEVEEVRVPLDKFVRGIAREAAWTVIKEHQKSCAAFLGLPPVIERVAKLEIRLSSLIAFMAGSGLLGGAAGAALVRFLVGA